MIMGAITAEIGGERGRGRERETVRVRGEKADLRTDSRLLHQNHTK
jgi:hypothetical protein